MSNASAVSFVQLLRANIDNEKLSDEEFRSFVKNSLPVVEEQLKITEVKT